MRFLMRWLGFGGDTQNSHEADAWSERLHSASRQQALATSMVERNSHKQIRRAADAQIVVESSLRKMGPGAMVVNNAEEAMAIIEGRHNASRRP